jgi:hypothetical protein
VKPSREQEELNEILLKNMTKMKHNKNVGQTYSNTTKEVSNDESHKRREQSMFSNKITSMNEKNRNNSFKDNTLQKRSPKNRKRKWHTTELIGEFKKIIPPSFDGETEEGTKSWILNMGKYFQIYNYYGNLRGRLEIYQLNGKAAIWW